MSGPGGWQQPGPQPPYGGPPGSQGPGGHYGPGPGPYPYPPPQRGGVPGAVAVLVGFIVGCFIGVGAMVLVLFAVMGINEDTPGWAVFALVVGLPLLLPVPLLFWRSTRLWGAGALAGAALSNVILAGSCVWIIQGLENAH